MLGRLALKASVWLSIVTMSCGDSGQLCAESGSENPPAIPPNVGGATTPGDPNQIDPRRPDKGSPNVQFGGNANQIYHAFRHVDQLGLDRAAVQGAIRQDLL